MDAKTGLVVKARVPGCPTVLGVVSELKLADGATFPSFFVSDPEQNAVPVLFISPDYPGSTISYEVTDQTLGEFFTSETRRNFAGFYKRLCEEKTGLAVNELVTLNVCWL